MERTLLIAISFFACGILVLAALSFPIRFKLQSTSPTGKAYVMGLRFQNTIPQPLDGTLRLFVSHHGRQDKQQTLIPWGRDLSIEWRDNDAGDRFVITKGGEETVEFQITETGLKCIKGHGHLAADPYNQIPPKTALTNLLPPEGNQNSN